MESLTSIKYETLSQPNQVRLDTTTRCNASCLSCHKFLSHRVGEMPIEGIQLILQDIASFPEPLMEIVPVNYGEFLIRKDWFEILQLIKKTLPKTRIAFATNGSLFDKDTVQKLCSIETLAWLNFSVNAGFSETYKKFMGFPPQVVEKIEIAISEIKVWRKDLVTVVSMVHDPQWQTQIEKDKFIDDWKDKAYVIINSASSCNLPFRSSVQTTIPCRSIYSDIVIGYDGKIGTCCFDATFSLDLGIYNENLLAIWNSDKFKKLRELHSLGRRNEVDLCSKCDYA